MAFLSTLQNISADISSRYPDAFFYEAQLTLVRDGDGRLLPRVSWGGSKIIFARSDGTTLIVTVSPDNFRHYVQEVGEPWLEDRPMTVWLPCDLKDAVDRLYSADIVVPDSSLCALRFPLDPSVTEPQWIFGTAAQCVAVGVYSAEVR